MSNTDIAAMVQPGKLIFNTANPSETRVIVAPHSADRLPDLAWFVTESDFTGCRTYNRATGRTRMCWGVPCPTVERYEIETIADDEGVIWGVPGARIPGVWAGRSDTGAIVLL